MNSLDKLKIRLGILDNKQDEILELLLEEAGSEIMDYCNINDIPEKLEALQRELTIIYYNRQGTEGEVSRSEGGISINYGTDIPTNLKNRLDRYRKAKVIKY